MKNVGGRSDRAGTGAVRSARDRRCARGWSICAAGEGRAVAILWSSDDAGGHDERWYVRAGWWRRPHRERREGTGGALLRRLSGFPFVM